MFRSYLHHLLGFLSEFTDTEAVLVGGCLISAGLMLLGVAMDFCDKHGIGGGR